MSGQNNGAECPFCAILAGSAPGTVIARDEGRGFAIIQSIHPESTVHWLAMPIEHANSTESFERENGRRFVDLFEFAVAQAKDPLNIEKEPYLVQGFTLKTHFGSYETVPHPKIHILSKE